MRLRTGGRYWLLGLAILACLVSLGLAVHRIYGTERALALRPDENIVWNMAQNERELALFLEVLNAYGRGSPEVDRERLLLRFDLLWSRLGVATAGEIAARVAGVDKGKHALDRARRAVADVEGNVVTLRHGDTPAASAIAARLRALRPALHEAAVAAVHFETKAALDADATRRRELVNALGLLGGALLGTSILVVLLLGEVRRGRHLMHLAQAAAAENRNQQALLRGVIDAVPALINVKDCTGRYVLMNRFQAEVYGTDPVSAVGQPSAAFTGPAYGGESARLDRGVLESGEGIPFVERPFMDARGQQRLWWQTKQPLRTGNGTLGHVVTVAMDITEIKTIERARRNLARHVSPNMVDILAARDEPIGEVRAQEVSVVFADIVGFTRFSAQHAPVEVMATLRDLHGRLTEIVLAQGGTLEKFLGDGLMATFGTPLPDGREASRTLAAVAEMVAMAVAEMVAMMDTWNGDRTRDHRTPLRVGIGAHFGPVVLGEVGTDRRIEFAVIGDAVNLASRLQDLTRQLGASVAVSRTLLDRAAAEGADGRAHAEAYRLLGPRAVDGFDWPVDIAVLERGQAASGGEGSLAVAGS